MVIHAESATGSWSFYSSKHSLGIMGDHGGRGKAPIWFKNCLDVPLICSAALRSAWKYIQRLVPDRRLGSQACETQAVHVVGGGQSELSIIEFICTAIKCPAEVD